MKSYMFNSMLVAECDPKHVTIEIHDAPKTEMPMNSANAGYFGGYSENGIYFTLPVAHLVAGFSLDALSNPEYKYMRERGIIDGNRWRFDSSKWSYCNDFYQKNVSTFIISEGEAHIDQYVTLPDCEYAVSGVPILMCGKAVTFADAREEGWSESSLYATRHTFVGVKDNGTVVVASFVTSTSNLVLYEEAAVKLQALGVIDAIKLDGGGSAYMSVDGTVVKTGENRHIHSIIRFDSPIEDDPLLMPTLKKGDKNNSVGALQTLLNYRKYGNLNVDCSYGGKTRAAVVALQTDSDLAPTGVTSQEEWVKLIEG